MYQKHITFLGGNPSSLLSRKFWVKQMILVQWWGSAKISLFIFYTGFVNTIISSKHYLKSFVVVVGG